MNNYATSTNQVTAGIGLQEIAVQLPFAEPQVAESGLPINREQMLIEHLPMVRYVARRIHERLPQHVDLEDLVSAGIIGLIDAFSKFDHTKQVQFKSYAQFRIRGAILDSLRMLDWSPRELRRKGRAVEEAIRSITQRARSRRLGGRNRGRTRRQPQ